jgi:hypothetical protein
MMICLFILVIESSISSPDRSHSIQVVFCVILSSGTSKTPWDEYGRPEGTKVGGLGFFEDDWFFCGRLVFLWTIGLFVRRSGLLRRGGEVGGSGEVELSEEG